MLQQWREFGKYINEFVHGKVRLLGEGSGGLVCTSTVESWLVGVCHEVT